MHFRPSLKPMSCCPHHVVIRNRQFSSSLLPSCRRSCCSFCLCFDIFDFASTRVDHDSVASLVFGYTVSSCAEIEHLQFVSFVFQYCLLLQTYLDVSKVIPLHRGDTSSLVESNLPNSTQVREQVAQALTSLDVPHFERAV